MKARKSHDDELAEDREMIRRSRDSIADAERQFADSVDRLIESQRLLRATRDDKAAKK